MVQAIENSGFWKALSALARAFYGNWKKGALCAGINALKRQYAVSTTGRLWLRFCAAENPAETSRFAQFLDWLRRGLMVLGVVLAQSLFYRAVVWCKNLYLRATKGSMVFGWINRLSLHQWLLVAFALYLPLNYAIRDVVGIAILASVWEEAFLCGTLAIILWRQALQQTTAIHRISPIDAYILLFLAVGFFLMSAVQPHPEVAWDGYRAQVTYILWFFLILRLIEDERDLKVLYYTFLGMAALLCLHGIYQYVIGVEIPSSWVSKTEAGVRTRVFSIMGSPNIFGCFIVMATPLAAALIYYCKSLWSKLFFFCLTGLMCLCLLFTFSKGAWVGMVVAVLLFSLFLDRRLLALAGVGIAGALVAVPSITSRLTYLFTADYAAASAVGGRSLRWEIGLNLLTENNPWLGFGLGRFGGAVAMNNKLLDETEDFYYFYMDNYYLKTMVEMGYLGLIFYLLMMLALFVWGLRAVFRSGLSWGELDLLGQVFGGGGRAAVSAGGRAAVSAGKAAGGADVSAGKAAGGADVSAGKAAGGADVSAGKAAGGAAAIGFIGSLGPDTNKDPLLRAVGNPRALAVGIFSGLMGVLVHCYFENIFEETYMMAYFWGLAAMLMYLGFFRRYSDAAPS